MFHETSFQKINKYSIGRQNYIDRVIVNRVRRLKNRSTVQSQTITGNCCTHVILYEQDDDLTNL